MDEELKKLIEEFGRAFEEFKTADAQQKAELKKGIVRPDLEQKLQTISAKLDDFEQKKAAIEQRLAKEAELREELERKFNGLRVTGDPVKALAEAKAVEQFNIEVKALARVRGLPEPGDLAVEDYNAYKGAFRKWMRKGKEALSAEEFKAMSVGNDAEGGYQVLPDMSGRIVQKIFDLSPIRAIANVQAISSDRLEGIEDTDEASVGWVGETATRSDTNTPKVGRYEIPAHELYAKPKATQKLLDDASVDIEAWLAGKVADKFAREEGAQFITGDGINKPRGFTKYTTAATADGSRAWGSLEHVATGASGDFAASTPADTLFDVVGAMKDGYLAGARWVTRRSVIAKIRKFKESTTNAYIWQPGLQAGQPSQLLGFPVTMAEDMPALAANSLSLAFGNFGLGYQIVDRLGVRVLRDPYTDKPYVVFYTTKRVGGAVVNFEAIKLVKFI